MMIASQNVSNCYKYDFGGGRNAPIASFCKLRIRKQTSKLAETGLLIPSGYNKHPWTNQ